MRSYAWSLKDFAMYLESRGLTDLREVTRATLEAWQDRLIEAQMKPRSRSLATTALRQFLKWAADHEYCDPRLANWLATVRLRPLEPKPLPPADLSRLRAHFGRRPKGGGAWYLQAMRNRALFFYLLATGARVSEALQVPRTGYERATVRQKGGSEKLLAIPESVQYIIKEYIDARKDREPHLFVSHPGERPMEPGAVRAVWAKVCADLGIQPFTTHALRHTFATELLEKGIDSRIVAALLGHHGMQSIMGYTKVRESQRQLAMTAIDSVIQAPTLTVDPRLLGKTSRRGRPRFQILRPPDPDRVV